jgi:spore germination protein
MMLIDYTIQTGDTLWSLAQRFGTSVEEIMFYNPQITDADHIYVGQTITLPVYIFD